MKSKMLFFVAIIASAALISCSEDDEKTLKGDPDITHVGEKWTITSINYTLIDQSTSGGVGQTFKTGSEGTGAFYFVDGQPKGSFEMRIADYNKEDFFNYTIERHHGLSSPILSGLRSIFFCPRLSPGYSCPQARRPSQFPYRRAMLG